MSQCVGAATGLIEFKVVAVGVWAWGVAGISQLMHMKWKIDIYSLKQTHSTRESEQSEPSRRPQQRPNLNRPPEMYFVQQQQTIIAFGSWPSDIS